VREQLTMEMAAVGFYLSGHLFDESVTEVRRFAKRQIADLIDTREPQLLAGIITDFRVINGQRGKLALFKLDDKSGTVDARADEALIAAHRQLLKDDELVVVMGKLQPDRFAGGMQLTVTQLWSLEQARCRFGKYQRVAVNGHSPDVARLLAAHPPLREVSEQGELLRGLGLRLAVLRQGQTGPVTVELQLGEQARFYPSDAALAGWRAQADEGRAVVVYE
jgi:DNA polymerase-3 subunit alpha